jgi:uncharacterized protein with GYD domain
MWRIGAIPAPEKSGAREGLAAKGEVMSTYVVLGNYTEQGVQNIKQVANLRQAAEQWTAAQGGRVLGNYTTLGPYDFIFIVELPSAEVALEGALLFGSQGQVRTQTLLAFPANAAEAIAQRLP